MGHARDPNELLEILGDEPRPVVGDDPGSCPRVQFLGPLQDDFDVRLGHRLPEIPVDNVSAAAVRNAAQVVERPADVEIGNIDVLMLMGGHRLLKASPACPGTRHTLDGLTATTSASKIINVSRP